MKTKVKISKELSDVITSEKKVIACLEKQYREKEIIYIKQQNAQNLLKSDW